MRKKHVRDLLKKIDLDGDAVFQHYIAVKTVPGAVADGDKYLVLGFRAFSDGEYLSSLDYLEQADEIYRENEDAVGRVIANIMRISSAGRLGTLDALSGFADEAQRCAEISGNRFLIAYAISAVAAVHHYFGRHDEGQKAIASLSELEGVRELNLLKLYADYYSTLCFVYEKEKNYEFALKYAELAYFAYFNYYDGVESVNSMNALMTKAFFLANMNETMEALRILREVEKIADGFGMYQSIMRSKKFQAEVYHQIGEYEMAFIKQEEYFVMYAERMDDRLRNPEDEYQTLKLAVGISQDELMIKNGELFEKNKLLEELVARQTIVRKLGYVLASARRTEDVFALFADGIKEIVDFDWLTIGLVDGDFIGIKYDYCKADIETYDSKKIPIDSRDHILSHAVRNDMDFQYGHAREVKDYVSEEYYRKQQSLGMGMFGQSAMVVRMIYDEKVTGVICIRSFEAYKYSSTLFSTVRSLVSFLSIATNNAIQNEILDENAKRFEGVVLEDELTGLENRRSYEAYANKLFSDDEEYTVIFLDMNHLKQVNDGLGHAYGDRYLRAIAMVMNSLGVDYRKFRLSGDEFAIIFEGVSYERAAEVIGVIKKQCARLQISDIPVAVAAGCAVRLHGVSPAAALASAEERMYADKEEYYRNIG